LVRRFIFCEKSFEESAIKLTKNNIVILRPKLYRPPVARDILPRDRLLEFINDGLERPLTLISAPAGYGKTTLASRWLEACDVPSAWVSLDDQDNDLRFFLLYLFSAVQIIFPQIGQRIIPFLESPHMPSASVLTRDAINALDQIENPFILVLDDYHYIHEKAVHNFLTKLLKSPPHALHLILLTRRDPPLPINTLRARAQLTEIAVEHLRFTVSETGAFLRKVLKSSVKESTAAIMEQKTEGWVTGLRLAALSLGGRKNLDQIARNLKDDFHYVTNYLLTEVLAKQPPAIGNYLMEASILDRFCSSLCEALHPANNNTDEVEVDGVDFITWLKDANLFVAPLDEGHSWFRYHHLFKYLLWQQLKKKYDLTKINMLHARASKWFAEHDFIDNAINHALAAGEIVQAAQIVEQKREAILNADKWYICEHWLSLLPEEIKQRRPKLLLAQAWILYHKLKFVDILPIIEKVESLVSTRLKDQPLYGEINFFRGYSYFFQMEGARSLKYLENALAKIPVSHYEIRGQAEMLFFLASQIAGREKMAVQKLTDLLSLLHSRVNVRENRLLATLVFIHIISSNLNEAFAINNILLNSAVKGSFKYARSWGTYLQGLIHFYRSELDAAINLWGQALPEKNLMHSRAAVEIMAGLSYAYQRKEEPDKAKETMEFLFEFVHARNDFYYLSLAYSCKAHLSLMQGDPAAAVSALDNASDFPMEPMLWWLEIPPITCCRVLLAQGTEAGLKNAEQRLQEYLHLNRKHHNRRQMIDIMLLLVVTYKKQKRDEETMAMLKRALALAQPGGWISSFHELGFFLVDLLKRLTKPNVPTDFVRQILDVLSCERCPGARDYSTHRRTFLATALPQQLVEPLTNREIDVLELLDKRLQNKEISEELFISPETVKSHLKNIYQKLNVANRRQAVLLAKNIGILRSKAE